MLIYSGTRIRTTFFTYEGESQMGRYSYEIAHGEIVADVFDFWLDDNEPRRVVLTPDEWELVEDAPDLHADMYERGLFDD